MTNDELKKISIEPDHKQELFKLAAENRQLEIELLWKRTTIFWGFNAALFIGVAAAMEHPRLPLVLSSLGIVFSLIWTLSNRASKAWQESWEIKSEIFFSEFNPEEKEVYKRVVDKKNNEKIFFLLRPFPYSVSRLLILLSDFVVIFWFGMCIYLLPWQVLRTFSVVNLYKSSGLIFFLICLVYCVYVLMAGKSRSQEVTKEEFKDQRQKSAK